MTTGRRGLLAREVAMELGLISLVPIDTGTVHAHGSMQIGIWFAQKGDGPKMLPWMLCVEHYVELLDHHSQMILNRPPC